ncbi:osmotically inducible protein OsmC [Gelidibacter algens]|uniref:Osmotically inducible protein OsmC n=1 Tax=Gelidibacter algens TaxID=49280 RepID=A0A1A7QZR6_9FLAO|nr:OsmC family protein [Gelidibacter algens]OBX24768.1 OsmC family peroxiredoxin [Gelidibacter algens]RAJ26745.1 osmotically inducible protein OsmC [Gelidibacter algens]
MKFNRTAKAHWKGGGKDGKGSLTTESGVLKESHYAFKTRFEDAVGTNPEELIGAAHAGCFTMQLSFFLVEEGFTAESLDTQARVYFEDGSIPKIELELKGKVPGMDESKFKELATKAKENCPVSKLLNADITLKTTFES